MGGKIGVRGQLWWICRSFTGSAITRQAPQFKLRQYRLPRHCDFYSCSEISLALAMAWFASLPLFFAIAAAVIAMFGLAWTITRFGWHGFTGRR
jgi:hypothetical protein